MASLVSSIGNQPFDICVDHVSGEYKMSRTEHTRGQKVQAESSQGYNEYILSRSAEHVRYGELEP